MSSLKGYHVALSASDSPDRSKMGFSKQEVTRALLTVCGALIRSEAKIVYAGDLRTGGATLELFRYLTGVYAGQDVTPFLQFVPESALRRETYESLHSAVAVAGSVCQVAVVVNNCFFQVDRTESGLRIKSRSERLHITSTAEFEAWLQQHPTTDASVALSQARQIVAELSDARVSIGGKMGILGNQGDQFEGEIPGIFEEGMLTLTEGKPLIPLAAFGGATRDLAIALKLMNESERVPRTLQIATYTQALQLIDPNHLVVPPELAGDLKEIVESESIEHVAQRIVQLLEAWIPLVRNRPTPTTEVR